VDIGVVTTACRAVMYTVILLVIVNVIAYKLGTYRGRMDVVRTSSRYTEEAMTLKAGQTLVTVIDTTKDGYFLIGDNAMDSST
jgi:hypothetical protein